MISAQGWFVTHDEEKPKQIYKMDFFFYERTFLFIFIFPIFYKFLCREIFVIIKWWVIHYDNYYTMTTNDIFLCRDVEFYTLILIENGFEKLGKEHKNQLFGWLILEHQVLLA